MSNLPHPLDQHGDRPMTNAEAVMLCRFAKACCPQQQFDSYTPDAWFELLGDLRFDDCKEALTRVVRRQPFVSPAEIREECREVRAERLEVWDRHHRHAVLPPADLADDPAATNRWQLSLRARIANGEITHPDQVEDAGPSVATSGHDVIAELGHAGQDVPSA